MIHRIFICFLLLTAMLHKCLFAEDNEHTHVHGLIYGLDLHEGHQDTIPLYNANIFWINTTVGTITNNNGEFAISRPDSAEQLVISYVGYENDTLVVQANVNFIRAYLAQQRTTEEVAVYAERPKSFRDAERAVNAEIITETGLRTLACCNLAESFENTASVDVEQTDAVSGAKRIKMLGLAGFYTQVLIEKNPTMRGLVSPFSLDYIPGFWIESIDISKGTSSVATGYESITGQINVELKKPEMSNALELNGYQNNMGRSEVTLAAAKEINPQISTMLLSYGSYNQRKWDENADTFMDMPLITHLNLLNRWKYSSDNKDAQLGFKVLHDNREAGQESFDFNNPGSSSSLYGSHNRIQRYEFFSKAGLSLDEAGSSIGLILSGFQHFQDSFWGLKNYSGDESSFYANLIFQKSFLRHSLVSGLSYTYNKRDEIYLTSDYKTLENVPGLFAEYTYQIKNKLTAMGGFRYDFHNLFGSFYTPRFHFKYQAATNTSFRFSLGKGYRIPQVFMDNPAILASSKELIFVESLGAEEAWNAGLQIIKDFQLGANRPASLIFDFYRTDFQNQIIVDMEQDFQKIFLYNLDGRSYSNSAQLELTATVARGIDITTAYRFNDVKTTYLGQLQEIPLSNRHKGLLVLSYLLPNTLWQFDVTAQFNGKTRLPNTSKNPIEYQLDPYSPSYALFFAQVTRKFSQWEFYAGIENITDYRQANPIVAWNDPFSPYFDSSIIWGPTVGRRMYVGVRFN